MSKAVLISIRPEWVEKILSGEKTLEVRKTRPKLETPFKVYIYCTAGNLSYEVNNGMMCNISGGKLVVGEFTCNKVTNLFSNSRFWLNEDDVLQTCLSAAEMRKYANGANGLYGWHISDLKIYDTPKELPQFRKCCGTQDCDKCQFWENTGEYAGCLTSEERRLNRAPRSWCYVEELNNG